MIIQNKRGQTLVSAMLSVAISSIMIVVFMGMTDHMNKSAMHFQKTTSRSLFEMQVAGALGQQTLCSCNLAGRSLPVGSATPVAIDGISTDSATCPVPAGTPFDLYQASPAGGYPLEGGLRVRSIEVVDVTNTGANAYQASLRVNYGGSDGIQLKARNFFMYFTRNTTNPASTLNSPILETCTVSTAPSGGRMESPPGTLAGACSDRSTAHRGSSSFGSSGVLSVAAPAIAAPIIRNGRNRGSTCSCEPGYQVTVLYSSSVEEDRSGQSGGSRYVTTTSRSITCMKL